MGQLTPECFARVEELEILLKVNLKLIRIIEKQKSELILKGTHKNLIKSLEFKISCLEIENEIQKDGINYINKNNELKSFL